MRKNISKILGKLKIRGIPDFLERNIKIYLNFKGFKSPIFCFGAISLALLVLVIFSSEASSKVFLAQINQPTDNNKEGEKLFFNQNENLLETPDLGLIGENSLVRVISPQIFSSKTLGVFFSQEVPEIQRVIQEYIVEQGDTLSTIAEKFNISPETLFIANDLTKKSKISAGQKLIILPVDGVVHHVRSGDTVSEIARKYKGKNSEIVAFNELSGEADIYIGDILIIPGGKIPEKPPQAPSQVPLANAYFIFPTQGKLSQGVHWYNAIDIANSCGTPVYAAAAGTVLKVKLTTSRSRSAFGGLGNHIAILHPNGVITYYGHLLASLVGENEEVYQGQRIASIGGAPGTPGAGLSTGCHLHFGVNGAKNPLADYSLGSNIKYK